jgi:hypothetical protein
MGLGDAWCRCRVELDKFAPEGDEDEQAMRIKLLIFRIKNKKLLEMDSFLPPQTYLESLQTTDFGKRKLETLGDGYAPLTAQTTIKKSLDPLQHYPVPSPFFSSRYALLAFKDKKARNKNMQE